MGIVDGRGHRYNRHTPDCPLTLIYTRALGLVTHISVTKARGLGLRPLLAQAGAGQTQPGSQDGSGQWLLGSACLGSDKR